MQALKRPLIGNEQGPFTIVNMTNGLPDLAQIRLDNALLLFEEFVHATIKRPDAATLRGLEGRFAERLHIQPSYWSQIKGRSRQIGERLARQFEQLCRKPSGWMDVPHRDALSDKQPPPASGSLRAPPHGADDEQRFLPQDDDERFIVGLVLTYYRRHPQRAKGRLLDLLGEVLVPTPSPPAAARAKAPVEEDGSELWRQTRTAVAPLKKKR